MNHSKLRRAFTLVELLTVIAILSILIAWLLPGLSKSREQARLVACLSNNKQFGTTISVYAADHEGYFPVPPLGQYFTGPPYNLDVSFTWMGQFIGGDDIGGWPVVSLVPAETRPLAKYIDPYSQIFHCPSDDSPSPWTYGQAYWDYLCTSYAYNAAPYVGFPGLYGARTDEVTWPSLTIAIGDKEWGCTRPNLPSNDLWSYQNDPRAWWHPDGFRRQKAAIAMVDGHAEYTPLQILVANTDDYRRDAYPGQGVPGRPGDF